MNIEHTGVSIYENKQSVLPVYKYLLCVRGAQQKDGVHSCNNSSVLETQLGHTDKVA